MVPLSFHFGVATGVSIDVISMSGQLLRGLPLAAILYPFYPLIIGSHWGKLVLFGALWGVALVGSVEPQPGSIEGIIYTRITLLEHTAILVAVAAQMFAFVWLLSLWEKPQPADPTHVQADPKKMRGYSLRFILVHLITYWVVGIIFYEIAGYAQALEEMEIFQLWRPLENLPAVLLVFFGQIFRGGMLSLLLYPFYTVYIRAKHGWLLLFLLILGLTILGSPVFLPELIRVEGSWAEFLQSLVIGIPEILTQALVFSVIFFWWQRRAERRQKNPAGNTLATAG